MKCMGPGLVVPLARFARKRRRTKWVAAPHRVEVDDREIRVGRKDELEQAVLAKGGPVPGVRSLVRKWRTGQDETAHALDEPAYQMAPSPTL